MGQNRYLVAFVLILGCSKQREIAQQVTGARDSTPSTAPGFTKRLVYRLTHLDGKPLPVPYVEPSGRYMLTGGDLTLDPDGSLWLELDLVPDPEPAVIPAGRMMLVQ